MTFITLFHTLNLKGAAMVSLAKSELTVIAINSSPSNSNQDSLCVSSVQVGGDCDIFFFSFEVATVKMIT